MKTSTLLNLNQTVLKVAVNKLFPFCDFKTGETGAITLEPSIELYYLQLLMKVYNFNVQLMDMKNQWGTKVNHTWDGVIGMVYYGKADFGMCGLSPTYERLKFVDFSPDTIEDVLSIITSAAKPKQYPFIVSVPFTASVWTLLCLTILVLSICQYYNSNEKLFSLVFKHYAMILRQSIRFNFNFSSSPILYCLWLLLGLVFSTSYVGVFHSILTLVEYEDPLDTPEAIVTALAQDRVILLTADYTYNSYLVDTATPSSSPLFYEMLRHNQRNKLKKLTTHSEVLTEIYRWNNTKPFVLMTSIVYINQINAFFKEFQNFFVSKRNFLSARNSIAFPRNSSLRLPFNLAIKRIFESGLSQYWVWQTQDEATKRFKANPVEYFQSVYNTYLPELANPKPEQITADVRTLVLEDLKVLFYLCLAGLAISLIIFLLEIFWYLLTRKFSW